MDRPLTITTVHRERQSTHKYKLFYTILTTIGKLLKFIDKNRSLKFEPKAKFKPNQDNLTLWEKNRPLSKNKT